MENLLVTVCENVDNEALGIFQGARFPSFEAFRVRLVEWMAVTHQRLAINSSRQMGVKYGVDVREQFKFRSIYFRCFRHGPGRRTERKQPNREKNARDCGAYMRVVFDSSTNEMLISTCHLRHRFHTPCREDTVKMVGRRSQWFEWVEELAPTRGQMVSRYVFSEELYTPENVFDSLQHLHHIDNVIDDILAAEKKPTVKLVKRKYKPRIKKPKMVDLAHEFHVPSSSSVPYQDLQLFTSVVRMMNGQTQEKEVEDLNGGMQESEDMNVPSAGKYVEIMDSPAKYEKMAMFLNTTHNPPYPPKARVNLTLQSEQKLQQLLAELNKPSDPEEPIDVVD